MARKQVRSNIAWSTVDRIVVHGKDLPGEILGHLNLGDMAFLELTGRTPTARESKLFNAMVVTLVEHGITPNALATRLTYLGAPESLQTNPVFLISGRRAIKGWYSGLSIDSEDTLAFSVLTGVRSMNEVYPLERAADAYERMMSGKARFRVVIQTGA